MIKQINLLNVRGITESFTLKEGMNKIVGGNAVGKSTIINGIKDIYRGKTKSIKDGIFQLTDDTETMYQIVEGTLPNKQFGIGEAMDIITPGFFMNNKTIKGINKSQEDQRAFMSEIIGIDRFKFFLDNNVDYTIKGMIAELKELHIKETTYASESLIEKTKLKELIKVSKPKEVKLTQSNQLKLDQLKDRYKELKGSYKTLYPFEIVKPIDLIQDKTIKGNEDELEKMKQELESIVKQGKNTPDKCSCCGQDIKDSEKLKESLRVKYTELKSKIDSFELIETKTIKGNIKEWEENQKQISEYKRIEKSNVEASGYNLDIETKLNNLEKQISDFKLVEGNQDKYEAYQSKLQEYNSYIQEKESIETRIQDYKDKIKGFNSKELEAKIEKYKETEEKFIKFIGDKLNGLVELDIIFYTKRKSPNSDGDLYKSTFEIRYKGKDYNELSGGEKVIVDTILSTIILKHYSKQGVDIDFLLIDSAEISTENLNKLYEEYIKPDGLQLITTRIKDGGNLEVVTG